MSNFIIQFLIEKICELEEDWYCFKELNNWRLESQSKNNSKNEKLWESENHTPTVKSSLKLFQSNWNNKILKIVYVSLYTSCVIVATEIADWISFQ